jgi:hypothetical protein
MFSPLSLDDPPSVTPAEGRGDGEEPSRFDPERPHVEFTGDSPHEIFTAVRTALGDHPDDIADSLKIFEFLRDSERLVPTSDLAKR